MMNHTIPASNTGLRRRRFFLLLRGISLLLMVGAAALALNQWQSFKTQQALTFLPPGSNVDGIPVGGLSIDEARQRVAQAYALPVEMVIEGSIVSLDPAQAGFQLNFEKMLAAPAAPEQMQAFRDFLWGKQSSAPLQATLEWSYDEAKLRAYLTEELAPRYNQPGVAPAPIAGTADFLPGQSGKTLDIEAAVQAIAAALPSRTQRKVEIAVNTSKPPKASFANLEVMLKQIALVSGLDAVVDVYVRDLKDGKEIHFASRLGEAIPVQPDISFTASSTIKIPILISIFRRLQGEPDAAMNNYLYEMIANSSNEAADALMKNYLDEVRGPLLVSEDIKKLGLENTFLAGYFALGSPLLEQFRTPANLRVDVNTEPDLYNQTTPYDQGQMLAMIYQCARDGSGTLIETFSGEMTQAKCQQIVEILKKDRQPYLIMTGIPEGTPLAHKHGYGSVSDVITTIGDSAIVFSPKGDYILVVFINNSQLLVFDPANELISKLSTAVYNYYNPPEAQQ